MKKMISFLMSVILVGTMLTGCNLDIDDSDYRRSKKKDKDERVEKTIKESFFELDKERYECYLDVLEDILEDGEWPDGNDFLVDGTSFGYIGDNLFSIFDIDMDGKEELLIELTTASMAGMVLRVFDYDEKDDEVVEEWISFPSATFYDNGLIYLEASHNQSGSEEVWPFALYQYNDKEDAYEYVGGAYGADSEYAPMEYNAADDADGDGKIYYIAKDGEEEYKPYTEEEYDAWVAEYLKDANAMYIPWSYITRDELELIDNTLKVEGAICPTTLGENQVITQYDLDGDGKKDAIEIRCKYTEEYPLSTNWCIYINGEEAWANDPEDYVCLDVKLYRVSDKRNYIVFNHDAYYNGAITGYCMYQVEDNELVEVLNPYGYAAENVNVDYLKTTIKYMTASEMQIQAHNQFNATAHMNWVMNYEYDKKDDCWEVADDEFELVYIDDWDNKEDGMTAHTTFTTYKSYDSEKVAYEVNVGDVLELKSIRFYDGKTYFKAINEDDEEGWFANPDSALIDGASDYTYGYFEEAQFAG